MNSKISKLSTNALSSTRFSTESSIPLLSVNIIPKEPLDYGKLRDSLKCLAQCEESIKFRVDKDTGNLVLATDGEINLEKAIYDAKDMYYFI